MSAHKSESPGGTGLSAEKNTNTAIIAPAEKIGNTAYLIARLMLAGHAVHKGADGDYLVCKYGLSRWCKDFAELQAFAKKLGVQ